MNRSRERISAVAVRRACRLNYVVPGAGLILLGNAVYGLILGVLFILGANAAVTLTVLFPDQLRVWGPDYAGWTPWAQGIAFGITIGAYLRAQWRFRTVVGEQQQAEQRAQRDQALATAAAALQADDPAAAVLALEPIAAASPDDLAVVVRLADAYTAAGRYHQAMQQWEHVRSLDSHGIYRERRKAQERRIAAARGAGVD